MLEKREMLLHKKMAAELEKAKDFNRAKNKRAALQCLKKKKLYEQQIEQLQNQQLKLEEQVITLEGSKTTAETFTALKSGAGAMKQLHKETNIDEVDKVLEKADMRQDVQEIFYQTPKNKQTMCFSATMPQEIKGTVLKFVRNVSDAPHHGPKGLCCLSAKASVPMFSPMVCAGA